MSRTPTTAPASSRFQTIFHAALKLYEKQTKKDLISHPLATQLQSCDSTSAILAVLQDQVREFDQARSGDERLTKWLNPTVSVLCAFSDALGEGISLVSVDTRVNISPEASTDIFCRYSRPRNLSLRESVSSFWQVYYLYLWVDRTDAEHPIGGQGCCCE